jgi:chorismate dehydratase
VSDERRGSIGAVEVTRDGGVEATGGDGVEVTRGGGVEVTRGGGVEATGHGAAGSGGTTRRVTRLGAVCYLNTKPLVYGLESDADFAVRFDVPSTCAELLEAGATDLGLIPSFEYAHHADYAIVPHVAIASHGPVESVAMFTRRPVANIRRIALDTSSRTSANLLRLLCAAWFEIEPTFTPAEPDLDAMLRDNDAAMLIGDPALFADPIASGVEKVDLGQTWHEMTGLPFVWAFWSGRADAADARISRALRAVRDRGLANVADIARREAPADAVRQTLIARYLSETIVYDLDGSFETGLRMYYALLAEHGLLERPADLRFFGD